MIHKTCNWPSEKTFFMQFCFYTCNGLQLSIFSPLAMLLLFIPSETFLLYFVCFIVNCSWIAILPPIIFLIMKSFFCFFYVAFYISYYYHSVFTSNCGCNTICYLQFYFFNFIFDFIGYYFINCFYTIQRAFLVEKPVCLLVL